MPWIGAFQRPTEQPHHGISTQPWYPLSARTSTSKSQPSHISRQTSAYASTDVDTSSTSYYQLSPTAKANIISLLKTRSVNDLKILLTDKETYNELLDSIDQVKDQKALYKELQKQTEECAKKNLEKESLLMELKNECTVIRTSELAVSLETFQKLEKQTQGTSSFCASGVLQRLQCAMESLEEESDDLHQNFMDGKIELSDFIQKYRKLRTIYHKRSLLHSAASAM